jgi:NAD(P)-dependent dehydrogenase (short-subunit alcohol dehydrogenase family)
MERSWRSAALGTLYFMQACFAPMRDHGGGKILNIGSGSALDGDAGAASYVAAKEAVRALTRVAAREWGPHGIHVNTLCPFARTPRWEAFAEEHPGRVERQAASLPLRRAPGDPELDIGRAAVFLVGDDSSYVTGQTLFVEGGRMRT